MAAAPTSDFSAEHRAHPLALVKSAFSIVVALFFFMLFQGTQMVAAIFTGGFEFGSLTGFVAILAILGIVIFVLLLILGSIFLSWRVTTWQLTDKGLRLRRGVLFKRDLTIPYERINAINTHADVVYRLLGLVALKVETAADDTFSNMQVDGMKRADAELLRSEIFKRRQVALADDKQDLGESLVTTESGDVVITDPLIAEALGVSVGEPMPQSLLERIGAANPVTMSGTGMPIAPGETTVPQQDFAHSVSEMSESFRGVFAGDAVVEEPVEAEYTLSVRELVLAGLANASIAPIFVAIIGFVSQLPAFLLPTSEQFEFLQRFAMSNTVIVIVMSLVVAVLIWAGSVAASVLGYGGFTLKKRGRRLEIGRGLVSQTQNMIDLNRVQFISINRGFIMKLLGYATITAHTIQSASISSDDESNTFGIIVHPFIKYDEVEGLLNRMMPDFADIHGIPQERIARVAVRRNVIRTLLTGWLPVIVPLTIAHVVLMRAGFLPIAGFMPWSELFHWTVLVVLLVILVFSITLSVLSGRNARVGHDEKRYGITTGALGRRSAYFVRNKIQNLVLDQNPFQRRLGIYTFRVTTATDDSQSLLALRDITQEQADELVEWSYSTLDNREEAYAALAEAGLMTLPERVGS